VKILKYLLMGAFFSLVVSLDGALWQSQPEYHGFIIMNLSYGILVGILTQQWLDDKRKEKSRRD
jgi:hypothetical protein